MKLLYQLKWSLKPSRAWKPEWRHLHLATGTLTEVRKTSDPLRILFCGADEFSIASLRAIYDEKSKEPALIDSIDVVCRPDKPTGRGLKNMRQGQTKHRVAQEHY